MHEKLDTPLSIKDNPFVTELTHRAHGFSVDATSGQVRSVLLHGVERNGQFVPVASANDDSLVLTDEMKIKQPVTQDSVKDAHVAFRIEEAKRVAAQLAEQEKARGE